jgi:hypothetical protein
MNKRSDKREPGRDDERTKATRRFETADTQVLKVVREVKPGRYQHYKGDLYEVLGMGRDRETLAEVVIYKGLYNHPQFGVNALWTATKGTFLEDVLVDGQLVPRFKPVQ